MNDDWRAEIEEAHRRWCDEQADKMIDEIIAAVRRGYDIKYTATHSEIEVDL